MKNHAVAAIAFALAGCQCGPVPCKTSPRDGEVCIPGGPFVMGHAPLPTFAVDADDYWSRQPANDWVPEHEVVLSPFFIGRFEVTWGEYQQCLDAGVCNRESVVYGFDNWDADIGMDPANHKRPVASASWFDAATYCLFRGKRLPTEAEWERAARTTRRHDYPWGNALPSAAMLDPATVYGNYAPPEVGSNEEDVTPEGVHDLYGSTAEWCADYADHRYYGYSPRENPQGPSESSFRSDSAPYGVRIERGKGRRGMLAGGDEWPKEKGSPVWFRGADTAQTHAAGFRCARDDRAGLSPPPLPSGLWPYQGLEWEPVPGRPR